MVCYAPLPEKKKAACRGASCLLWFTEWFKMNVLQRGRANDDAGPAAKRRHKGDGESAAANGVAAEDPMMADFAVCDWLPRATMLMC
jgi:hypothetical protein